MVYIVNLNRQENGTRHCTEDSSHAKDKINVSRSGFDINPTFLELEVNPIIEITEANS